MDKDELLERYEALGDERDFLAAKPLYEQSAPYLGVGLNRQVRAARSSGRLRGRPRAPAAE